MQKMTADFDAFVFMTVKGIPDNRALKESHMQSDLMGASGERVSFDQAVVRKLFDHFVFGHRFPARCAPGASPAGLPADGPSLAAPGVAGRRRGWR